MCPVPQLEQKLPLCPRRSMHAHGTSPSPLARVAGIYRAAHQITIKTHPPPCSGIRNRARSYCLVGLVGPQHHHRGVLPWAVALSSSGKDVTQKRGEKTPASRERRLLPGLNRNQTRRRECTAETPGEGITVVSPASGSRCARRFGHTATTIIKITPLPKSKGDD
jgi:hypothetical protein